MSSQSSFGKMNKGGMVPTVATTAPVWQGLVSPPITVPVCLQSSKGITYALPARVNAQCCRGWVLTSGSTGASHMPSPQSSHFLCQPQPQSPSKIKKQWIIPKCLKGRQFKKRGKQKMVAMEEQNSVFPQMFVPSASKGGLDWSQEGPSSGPSNLNLQQLDPETVCAQKHKREEHYPRLVDFMNILKYGEESNGNSSNEITNAELMELRQAEHGQGFSPVNTNLTLNPEGIDLTFEAVGRLNRFIIDSYQNNIWINQCQ